MSHVGVAPASLRLPVVSVLTGGSHLHSFTDSNTLKAASILVAVIFIVTLNYKQRTQSSLISGESDAFL